MTDKPIVVLRSPMNGGTFVVPPDTAPDFLEALLARGFTRLEDEQLPRQLKSKPKQKEHDADV